MRRAQHRTSQQVEEPDSLPDDVAAEVQFEQHNLDDGTTLVFSVEELDTQTANEAERALHRALATTEQEEEEDVEEE